jgi:hypothetical protein
MSVWTSAATGELCVGLFVKQVSARHRSGRFRRSRDRKAAVELASQLVIYLIIFACYGSHLHGSESGSVERERNVPGTPVLDVDSVRAAAARERMDQAPYYMDQVRRDAVLEAIQEVCGYRGWS